MLIVNNEGVKFNLTIGNTTKNGTIVYIDGVEYYDEIFYNPNVERADVIKDATEYVKNLKVKKEGVK